MMTNYTLPIVIEKDGDGYFAQCPSLQGCYTQGETYEEALASIKDAVILHFQDRQAHGEAVELPEMVSAAPLQVAA